MKKATTPQFRRSERLAPPEKLQINEAYDIVIKDIIKTIKKYAKPHGKERNKNGLLSERWMDDNGDIQLDIVGHRTKAEASMPGLFKILKNILTSENKSSQISSKIQHCIIF